MQRLRTLGPLCAFLALAACSGKTPAKKPMGQLPSAVTSAQPEWLPKRILAGRAVEDDAREAHLYQTRRISVGLGVREIAWAPDGSFVAVVAKRADDAKPRVFKLALGASFRSVEPEPISIEGEAVSSVAVASSATGPRIVYVAGQSLIEVGPSGRRTIDTGPYVALSVAVQPATSDLFLVAKHPGGVGLVRTLADGSKPRLLVSDHVEPGALALSADASYVAVAGASDKPGNEAALLLTSTEGGQVRRLAPAGAFAPRLSSFHPGGRLLAFGSTRDRKDGELYLVQVGDGGGVERVTFQQGDAPAFSPDGRSLAFSSMRGDGELADLYVARFLEEP